MFRTANAVRRPVVVWDREFKLVYLNPFAAKHFHLREAVGKTWQELELQWDYVRPMVEAVERVFATREPRVVEMPFPVPDQGMRWWQIDLEPFVEPDGRFDKVILFWMDITERKILEREKDRFLTTISHNLKNPLAAVSINAQFIIKSIAPDCCNSETMKRQAALILEGIQRANRIVDTLLDYGKISSGKIQAHCEPVEMSELVETAVKYYVQQASSKGVELKVGESCLHPVAMADRRLVTQVIDNLVSNAIKFTRQGSIELSCSRGAGLIRVEVRDTGRGIPRNKLAHLFEPYWRLEDQTTEGSGLGLAIVKAFVELMGGAVDVESEEGHGTTIGFTLPEAEVENGSKT